jgi:GNAT superfamily N-acetyltransferase
METRSSRREAVCACAEVEEPPAAAHSAPLMSIDLRPAIAADAPSVFELAKDFAVSFAPTADQFARSFDHLIAADDALLLVADEAGQPLGYLLAFDHHVLWANGRVAWIEEITVRADRRRQGIGHQLMEGFERWARSRGSRVAAVATRRATEFYAALGYDASATYFRKVL